MANDDDILFGKLDKIFKETYSDIVKDLLPDGVKILHPDYSKMSIEDLKTWNTEEAKKELKKRTSPLWKVMND